MYSITEKKMGKLKLFWVIALLFLIYISFANSQTLSCDTNTYAEYGLMGDKVTWLCTLNGTSSTFYCLSYIKDNQSGIVQINPDYQKKSEALLGINNIIEDRQFFTSQNSVFNVHFTKENLVMDGRNYTYGVMCGNGTYVMTFESSIIPEYENLKSPTTRWFWATDNFTPLFIGFLIFIILALAVATVVYFFKR